MNKKKNKGSWKEEKRKGYNKTILTTKLPKEKGVGIRLLMSTYTTAASP